MQRVHISMSFHFAYHRRWLGRRMWKKTHENVLYCCLMSWGSYVFLCDNKILQKKHRYFFEDSGELIYGHPSSKPYILSLSACCPAPRGRRRPSLDLLLLLAPLLLPPAEVLGRLRLHLHVGLRRHRLRRLQRGQLGLHLLLRLGCNKKEAVVICLGRYTFS